jgi:hypothetical protein
MPREKSTSPTTIGPPFKPKLLAKIVELAGSRYERPEDRALFETFILRLDSILDESAITGLVNVRIQQGDSIVFQTPSSIPIIILPGHSNPYGSVTGNNFTSGGWGQATDGKLECPFCNGDNFKFTKHDDERARNRCADCKYEETFIHREVKHALE